MTDRTLAATPEPEPRPLRLSSRPRPSVAARRHTAGSLAAPLSSAIPFRQSLAAQTRRRSAAESSTSVTARESHTAAHRSCTSAASAALRCDTAGRHTHATDHPDFVSPAAPVPRSSPYTYPQSRRPPSPQTPPPRSADRNPPVPPSRPATSPATRNPSPRESSASKDECRSCSPENTASPQPSHTVPAHPKYARSAPSLSADSCDCSSLQRDNRFPGRPSPRLCPGCTRSHHRPTPSSPPAESSGIPPARDAPPPATGR